MPFPFSFWKTDSEPPALLVGLLAHWKLNETSGNRADSSGNGHTMVEAVDGVGYAAGKLGNSALFGGPDSYLTSDLSLHDRTAFTLAAWHYVESVGDNVQGLILGAGQAGGHYCFLSNLGATIYGFLDGSQIALYPSPAEGVWVFVAMRYDGTRHKLFVDAQSSEGSFSGPVPVALPVTIGGDSGNLDPYVGRVDSASVWGRALTDAEIAALYNSGDGLDFESFTT